MTVLHTARKLSQGVVLFVAAAGFFFGQLFSGVFSMAATLAGVGGVLAGALATLPSMRRVVLLGCALAFVGAGWHAYEYYSVPHFPGNYYPWFLTGSFLVGSIIIAVAAARPRQEPAAQSI